jgi:hypothetical protein
MKRYILHTAFNIYHFEATQWEHSVHKHTYFEIIFILKDKVNITSTAIRMTTQKEMCFW